jgi:cell division protein FtsZ
VLRQGVQGISDIITISGIINRDFADVKTTMAGMGYAVMGTAVRSGQRRAVEAAQAAMASPLLESGAIDGARGILINISGSSSLKLSEVNEASSLIENSAHEDANIIFGAVLDETMGDEVKITVIATGFRQEEMPERRERMLTAVLREPAAPEMSKRPVTPKFASEEEDEEPVFVSVVRREAAAAEPVFGAAIAMKESGPDSIADRQNEPVAVANGVPEPVVVSALHEEHGENLDIPAFMRRGGL